MIVSYSLSKCCCKIKSFFNTLNDMLNDLYSIRILQNSEVIRLIECSTRIGTVC